MIQPVIDPTMNCHGAPSEDTSLARWSTGVRNYAYMLLVHLQRNWKIWKYFKINAFLGLFQSGAQVILFLYIGKLIDARNASSVGGNYASFLVVGLVFLQCLDKSVIGPFASLSGAYWSARLEGLLISPYSIWFYTLADTLWYNILTLINVIVIIIAGLIFGAHFQIPSSVPFALATCIFMVPGALGIGFMSASLFSLINAKGQDEPISWTIHLLQGVICGLYFPFKLLPYWLQGAGLLLPHTYVFDSMRRLLIPGYETVSQTLPVHSLFSGSPLSINLACLAVIAVVYMPLGTLLFRLGLRKAQLVGSLSRWT